MEKDEVLIANKITDLTISDLICYLQNPIASEIPIAELYLELHSRFKQRFYRKCLNCCLQGNFDEHLAKDIFQEAFIKLIKKISGFKFDKTLPDKTIGNKLVAWFGIIANNEFINYLRKYKIDSPLSDEVDDYESDYIPAEFEDEIITEENVRSLKYKLQQALATLTERERYILIISANYGCLGNKNHLPENVVKDLCENYSITANNIKTIRFRAFKKIKNLLSENTSTNCL
jgi:RNA polymerase sigma factor (sigma-70 family)